MIQKTARALLLAAVVAGTIAVLAPQSALAISNTPDRTGWAVSGKVYAYATDGTTVYAAGAFKKVTGPVGDHYGVKNIAAFDATTGAYIPTFAPTITSSGKAVKVSALALSPDGGTLYVGGQFDTVDGQPAQNFAAIDTATGNLVPGFSVSANQAVDVLLAGPDLLYMGGAFTKINGENRDHAAAISFDGTLSETWIVSTDAGNCPAPYYNPSTCSNGGDGSVRSMAMSTDGNTVFIGGEFYYVDGTPRNCIARVSAVDGSLDPWAVPWTTVTDDAQTHKPGPNMAWHIIATDTRLYVGFGRVPNFLQVFRLDDGTTGDRVWIIGTPGNVESLALWIDPTNPDNKLLFAGGHFGTAVLDYPMCGTYAHGLISVNPDTGAYNCSWVPTLKPFGGSSAPGSHQAPPNYVGGWTMMLNGNSLWIGGYFTSVAGVAQSGIARFTITGTPPPPQPDLGTFSPTKGPVGTTVNIPGFGFTGATDVQFNGVSAGSGFTVNSDTQITATVPVGATTGPITVVTPGGTVNSGLKQFHVTG